MHYLLKEFSNDWVIELLDKVNSLKEWEKLIVYIDSDGWDITAKDIYVNVINSLPDAEVVWVILFSAGFSLFDEVKCPKSFVDSSYAMIHHEAWSVDIWFNWVPRWDYDKYKFNHKNKSLQKEYSWMTDEEKRKYTEWYDVYLDRKRLLEIYWF